MEIKNKIQLKLHEEHEHSVCRADLQIQDAFRSLFNLKT